MHTLTYNGDATSIVGESFYSEYLFRDGNASIRHWVATDAVFDPETGKTRVEFDQKGL